MQLSLFMQQNYPNLELRPPLFYHWPIGIRFELGVEWKREYQYPDNPYIRGCYKRAINLFESLHSPTDEICVVIDVNDYHNGKFLYRQLRNFHRFVSKPLLYKVKYQNLPFIFAEDNEDEEYRTHRFSLTCKVSEIKYIPMLKAICNHDIVIRPSLYHRVYFINFTRKTIFHVYDDRGCDLIATSVDDLQPIYQSYRDWILDYDRPDIDRLFHLS